MNLYMEQGKDVTITSKGQLTPPATIRKALKLGAKLKVRVALTRDGLVTLRPLPEVVNFYGSLRGRAPYGLDEAAKARAAMGRRAASKR